MILQDKTTVQATVEEASDDLAGFVKSAIPDVFFRGLGNDLITPLRVAGYHYGSLTYKVFAKSLTIPDSKCPFYRLTMYISLGLPAYVPRKNDLRETGIFHALNKRSTAVIVSEHEKILKDILGPILGKNAHVMRWGTARGDDYVDGQSHKKYDIELILAVQGEMRFPVTIEENLLYMFHLNK